MSSEQAQGWRTFAAHGFTVAAAALAVACAVACGVSRAAARSAEAAAALHASASTSAAPLDVAVIVNAKTPVDNLSMSDLRKILLGDRQFWTPGNRITLLIRAPVAHERDVVLKRVYQMSEAQFRQYWIAKLFRAEVPAGPKVVYSNQTAIELVEGLPGAIGFVAAGQAPRGVKVARIDGHLPGEKGYPLQ